MQGDWVFLTIDTFGGLFSLFSLGSFACLRVCDEVPRLMNAAAEGSFDILGGIMYIIV